MIAHFEEAPSIFVGVQASLARGSKEIVITVRLNALDEPRHEISARIECPKMHDKIALTSMFRELANQIEKSR